MTKATTTTTLLDAKASAEQRIAAIDQELSKLDEQRGDLSLDVTLGVSGAEGKLRALGDKVRALHAERDDLTAAISAAGRRRQDAVRKEAEAEKQRAITQDAKLTAERAAVYDEIAATIKELADLSTKAVQLDREIDVVRQAIDPNLREHPLRQSMSKILDTLTTAMAESGHERDFPWPLPAHRIHNPNER